MGGAINARLLSAAELVRQGAVFADIGTDHAYLPLFLLEEGRICRAVCADINEGPLSSARANALEAGLSDKIEFVLTDGAAALSDMGIDDYAICGMGGELIAAIIERAPQLSSQGINLILQPMSRQNVLRKYLLSHGFDIVCESYSYDAGKYYVCMLVIYTGKIRMIDGAEAEIGLEHTEYVNKSAQIGYLKSKLRAYSRKRDGKMRGGECADEEEKIITEIERKIKLLEQTP